MQHNVVIPVCGKWYTDKQKELLIRELKKANPDLVLISIPRILRNQKMLDEVISMYYDCNDFISSNGFSTGIWLFPTIGYPDYFYGDNDAHLYYTRLRSVNGSTAKAGYCPLDSGFVDDFLHAITSIAKTGTNLILLEDEFSLTGAKGFEDCIPACCCDLHMQKYREIIGEDVDREELYEKLFVGGKNKYRDAWVKLQGQTLCDFCIKIEKAVHSINPETRIGLCANGASFDIECAAFPELVRLLAGNTKPFARLTGAPYWKNAMTLAANIEAVRVQTRWCGEDIEMISEGDTYPRPRHWISAAELECYDMILRADGTANGILKYMLDYYSSADYETGYIEFHQRNQKHYEEIDRRFSGKACVGLNLFENMLTFQNSELGHDIHIEDLGKRGYLPLMSQWLVCDNSIPTTYGMKDCASMVIGENAKYLTEEMLQNGVILDAQAAKFLKEAGVDVGIRSATEMPNPVCEYFIPYDKLTNSSIDQEGSFYAFDLDDNAEVLSEFVCSTESALGILDHEVSCGKGNGTRYPACYRYENKKGQRFVVYSFVPMTVYVTSGWNVGLFRNYCRQRQLADAVTYLQNGRPLPAMCYNHPQLYILCKKDDNSMAVGLWNIFPDTIYNAEIFLDEEYSSVDFYNCSGVLLKNKVVLNSELTPYNFAFFTVYR